MSELYLLNLDAPCSTTIHVKKVQQEDEQHSCGLGWYQNDDLAATLIRDSGLQSSSSFGKILSDWHYYRSTVFLCKIKNSSNSSEYNTQPFCRNYAGRDWLFAHSGNLDKDVIKDFLSFEHNTFEPMGNTDSELLFCALLNYLVDKQLRSLDDVDLQDLHSLLLQINNGGTCNVVLTDGHMVVCYQDKNFFKPLYIARVFPPNFKTELNSDSIAFHLQDYQAMHRTAVVISTKNFMLDGEGKVLQPGQMIVSSRAKIVWQSEGVVEGNEQKIIEKTQNPIVDVVKQHNNRRKYILNVKATTHTVQGEPLEYVGYNVYHTTEYSYDYAIEKSNHFLRVQPADDDIQDLVKTTLNLSVESKIMSFDDVFGNKVTYLDISKSYKKLVIHAHSVVKIYQRPVDILLSAERCQQFPLTWMPWQQQMMLPYLLPPELPESNLVELTSFAMSFVKRNNYNLIESLHDINNTIYEDFKYVQGVTTLWTTPFDIYVSRQGVCQDFANLFICLARLLGIPARYQVGYIYTGSTYENKEQADASHAWVEVYLPYVGWRGFDPTNGCLAGKDHIRVAHGRNYLDATPTTGTILIGGGGEKLTVSVKVEVIK